MQQPKLSDHEAPVAGARLPRCKIGFVLLSNSAHPLPSTRITTLNLFPYLRAAGFEPHIVFEPQQATEMPDVSDLAQRLAAEGFDAVFFQKVHGPSVEAQACQLRALGIKTIYGVCDLVNAGMVAATDATVAVTEYLRSLYPVALQTKIRVIHDGIENPQAQKQSWSDHSGSRVRRLGAVLVTSATLTSLPVLGAPPEWLEVNIVGRYPSQGARLDRLRQARWNFLELPVDARLDYARFLMNRRIHLRQWDPQGVYGELQRADIGIIPVDTTAQEPEGDSGVPSWKVKSENRLTMKMAIGLPVIATPIPAYEPVLQHGSNGFFARSQADWQRCLQALRDPDLRREIGARARDSVLPRYSVERQGNELAQVLRELLAGESLPAHSGLEAQPAPPLEAVPQASGNHREVSAASAAPAQLPPSQGVLRHKAAS